MCGFHCRCATLKTCCSNEASWLAVDHEGEVLESYVSGKRDKPAALRFMKKALKHHGTVEKIVTDGLRPYPAAMREPGNLDRREMGRWLNNRVENSHLPIRRRARVMLRFRRMEALQKFSPVRAQVHNHFSQERHLVILQEHSRGDARLIWLSGRISRPDTTQVW